MAAHAHLKKEFTEDEKNHDSLVTWLVCWNSRSFMQGEIIYSNLLDYFPKWCLQMKLQ